MDRKPGGSKLVYDRKTRSIKKVRINRFKRLLWWGKMRYLKALGEGILE